MIHKSALLGASPFALCWAVLAFAAPAFANDDAAAHETGIELLLEDSAETAAPVCRASSRPRRRRWRSPQRRPQ